MPTRWAVHLLPTFRVAGRCRDGDTFVDEVSMSKRYSLAEAKKHLTAVIREAEHGETIEITRHGRPVAVVLSLAEHRQLQGLRPGLWRAYQAWRASAVLLTDADVAAPTDSTRDVEPSEGGW
jgi:prevent-host-death family protein